MRRRLLFLWLLLPVAAEAYHLGPGQDRMRLDDAARLIEEAGLHAERAALLARTDGDYVAATEWKLAEAAYGDALSLLPDERDAERRRVRLERAKCQMFVSQLPEANAQLVQLVEEMVADEAADRAVLRDARRTLANSEYYMTWLMRLEGAPREDWEPRIEASRQTYKLIAEELSQGGDAAELKTCKEDLEAAVRLARMELSELQGLPLPSQ